MAAGHGSRCRCCCCCPAGKFCGSCCDCCGGPPLAPRCTPPKPVLGGCCIAATSGSAACAQQLQGQGWLSRPDSVCVALLPACSAAFWWGCRCRVKLASFDVSQSTACSGAQQERARAVSAVVDVDAIEVLTSPGMSQKCCNTSSFDVSCFSPNSLSLFLSFRSLFWGISCVCARACNNEANWPSGVT